MNSGRKANNGLEKSPAIKMNTVNNRIGLIDWQNGAWDYNSPETGAPGATLLFTGDWAPIRKFEPIMNRDPTAVYGDLMPVLRKSDLRVVNLESPLVDSASPIWKSGSVLKGGKSHISGLAAVPFDIATLANNHVFDQGIGAFQAMLALLKGNDIKAIGAGMTGQEAKSPLITQVKGVTIGLINFSEGEDRMSAAGGPGVFGWEIDEVIGIILELIKRVDLVMVIGHCGVEYIPFPPPYVARAFQQFVDAGANLVVGHHPHVPQGIQIYKNTPICYSLGNFVFYQETDLLFRKIGYAVKAGVTKDAVISLRVYPYGIYEKGLRRLAGREKTLFFQKLKEISTPLDDFSNIEAAWHGFLRYYGTRGFFHELSMIASDFQTQPEKGAAKLINRITTPQHRRHWLDAADRIISGRIDTSQKWAYELARQWLTEKIPP